MLCDAVGAVALALIGGLSTLLILNEAWPIPGGVAGGLVVLAIGAVWLAVGIRASRV